MFSATQIVVCALVGAVATVALAKTRGRDLRPSVELAVVVGLSILLWRFAGNTATLNDDPVPWVSPNDVLCPVITYVVLGAYGALRRQTSEAGWPMLRVLLTIVSLVVNVLTI